LTPQIPDPPRQTVNDLFALNGKTALVTGGARGVGFICAASLLDAGASVIITTRRAEDGDDARKRLLERGACEVIVVDLADDDGVEGLRDALSAQTSSLDILVNNAGVTWGAPLESYPSRAWSKVLNLDLAVPFKVVQASMDLLRAAAQPASPARIINIGSVDGHSVGPFDNYAYQAAKAGLHHLTRVLAARLGRENVTVNCIAPGPIRTDMTAEILSRAEPRIVATAALPRLADAGDIGGALIYLASRAGACVTGSVIAVDGGLSISTWGGQD